MESPRVSRLGERRATQLIVAGQRNRDDEHRFQVQHCEIAVRFGHAIDLAQACRKDPDAKDLTGLGSAGVLEVVEDDRGSTYRAVSPVKFAGWIYVLHCFQKKSESGIKTPKERGQGSDPRQSQGRETSRPGRL